MMRRASPQWREIWKRFGVEISPEGAKAIAKAVEEKARKRCSDRGMAELGKTRRKGEENEQG